MRKKSKGKKRKLTPAEKRAKTEFKKKFRWIFINGKQVRVKREPTIDGMDTGAWLQNNTDSLWLHQNEMWEDIDPKINE